MMAAVARLLVVLALCAMASACVSVSELVGPGVADDGSLNGAASETVTVGITHAELGFNPIKNFGFWRHSFAVVRSLESNSGFIAFQAKAGVFSNDAWTMTVWADAPSLDAFIASETHARAIANGYGALRRAEFLRVSLPREQVPKTMDELQALLVASRELPNTASRRYRLLDLSTGY